MEQHSADLPYVNFPVVLQTHVKF